MPQVQVAMDHYRELLFTSGLSSKQFIEFISSDRGFLGDHEYVCMVLSAFTARPVTDVFYSF
jgi:hypothetical protein